MAEAFGSLRRSASRTWAIAAAEIQKLRHNPLKFFTRSVQPALWLTLFGEVMAGIRGVAAENLRYLGSLAAGNLAQSALFVAIFYGIATIWERDLGILQRYLVSPAPRLALVLRKARSAGVRALFQAVMIYILAASLGANISYSPLGIFGVGITLILCSALFSLLSLIIACIVKTRQRCMGIGQMVAMPIFFASNAIYPLALMPGWMRADSRLNPLTYQVDALRALMLSGGTSDFGLGWDYAVLVVATGFMAVLAARMYPRLGYWRSDRGTSEPR